MTIRFCVKCLYSSEHPLGITFDKDGVCSGCLVHQEKDLIDWTAKWEELKNLTYSYRSNNKYDCIVPVSGGADSHFITYIVKKKLNLNPLLVNYNSYFSTSLAIKNLANLRIKFDCDLLSNNVNPNKVKKITKYTLEKFCSMYWPVLAGRTAFPVQVAIRKKIPLIIWGAHQGLEQVGMYSHHNQVEMSRRYRKDHDLLGYEAEDLLTYSNTLNYDDIKEYIYPRDSELSKIGVRGIYLGNYIRWDSKIQHEMMIDQYAYSSAKLSRTFEPYEHIDCHNYMNIHDVIKYYKHGYTRVTDHVVREIRFGRIKRDEGLKIVASYENNKPHYLTQFCEWIGMNMDGLNFILDNSRNEKFWEQISPKEWVVKKHSKLNSKIEDKHLNAFIESYVVNSKIEPELISRYITIGKGI